MTVTLDTYWLTLILSPVLPIIVAVITAKAAPGWVKSVVLIALSILTATLTQIVEADGTFDLRTVVVGSLVSFVTAVAAHFGFWKPSAVTGSEGRIQSTLTKGIG